MRRSGRAALGAVVLTVVTAVALPVLPVAAAEPGAERTTASSPAGHLLAGDEHHPQGLPTCC